MNRHKQTILACLRRMRVHYPPDWFDEIDAAIAAVEAWPEQQPATDQSHVCMPWHPVEAIQWNGLSLHADDLAVTIGEGDVAMATFVWPNEGEYAVCKRMGPAMPQA